MSQIPFTVSARTAKLIGQENFSNAEGAIIELVKNTYDADSQYCFILFENIGTLNATIYIIDFGCGMNDTTIQNCWMTIGTDDKLFNIKSDNGRIKTGAKGIGRFALNRLGNYTTMYTVPEKSQTSGSSFSTIFFAALILFAIPLAVSSFITNGLNSSIAISLGSPH